MSALEKLETADDLERHGRTVPDDKYHDTQAEAIQEIAQTLRSVPRDPSDPLYDILEELAVVLDTIEHERRNTSDLTEAQLREALHVEVNNA